MSASRHVGRLVFSACVLWGAVSGGGIAAAAPFQITSPSFKDGTVLDKKYVGNIKSNPNCVGENVSDSQD